MKNIPAPVRAYFASTNQPITAELITFALVNGTTLRYALWDTDIPYLSNSYSCNGPAITRGAIRTQIGTEAGSLDLQIYPKSTDMVGSATFLQALTQGLFDGATCQVDCVAMPTPPVVLGGWNKFYGYIADSNEGRTSVEMTIKDPLYLLNIQMPRNLYQALCSYTLYESHTCKANPAAFTDAGTVGSATKSRINFSSARAAGFFTLGYVKFTSGALNGLSYTVQSDTTGVLNVIPPMLVAPAPGDTFNVLAGCDHTQATCTAKFANVANFHGMPYIPVPETTL